MDEFELVARYFDHPQPGRKGVTLGIGDDGAVLAHTPGTESVVVTDTLVCDTHFHKDHSAASIGHRALAVNLSDIAAMGASAEWATLNLTLPSLDESWIEQFAVSLLALAHRYDVALVGGDTTRGPLSITMTVGGRVNTGAALCRNGAQPGDSIYVSGVLGGAAAALERDDACSEDALRDALWYPQPRLALGVALVGLAHSAVDISDGLLSDLGHILHASGNLGADIDAGRIPLYPQAERYLGHRRALELALGGGDDYELCFTVPTARRDSVSVLEEELALPLTCIGEVTASGACHVRHNGRILTDLVPGYRHSWSG